MPTDEPSELPSKIVKQTWFHVWLNLRNIKKYNTIFCLKIDKKKFFRLNKKRRSSKFARVSEAFGNKTSDLVYNLLYLLIMTFES